jgi:hypothetical protein
MRLERDPEDAFASRISADTGEWGGLVSHERVPRKTGEGFTTGSGRRVLVALVSSRDRDLCPREQGRSLVEVKLGSCPPLPRACSFTDLKNCISWRLLWRASEKRNSVVSVRAKLTKGYALMGFVSGGPN